MSENQTPEELKPAAPEPTRVEPVVDFLSLDDDQPVATPAPDLGAVDSPVVATPVAGPSTLNLGDPQQVAQATYGQTQQAYQQPQYQQPEYQPAPPPQQPPYQQTYPPVPVASGYQQMGQAEENTWASAAHWSALVASLVGLGFAGPLLVYLIKGPESPRVKAAAAESLNFEITYILAMLVSVVAIIFVVGIFTTIVLPVFWLVMRIIAAVSAARGENFTYPLTVRLVK
jgi:uncharacterized protein